MATTWLKQSMRALLPFNSFMSLVEFEVDEGDSQTYPLGSPLMYSSGKYIEWTSGNKIAALSAKAGQNSTGIKTNVYLLVPGIFLEANFLGSAAADNVLAQADHGTSFDIAKGANLLGTGDAAYYLQDSTSAVVAKIAAFKASSPEPQAVESQPAAGDTNARVWCLPLVDELHWYT